MIKTELDRTLFNKEQLSIIDFGIEEDLDVSLYTDPRYDYEQMRAICLGLQDGLDVSVYANPLIPELAMHITRNTLRRIALGLPIDTTKYKCVKADECKCE